LKKKVKAASFYKSEMKKDFHPRSLEFIELNAKNRGVKSGLKYAEVFEVVRVIK